MMLISQLCCAAPCVHLLKFVLGNENDRGEVVMKHSVYLQRFDGPCVEAGQQWSRTGMLMSDLVQVSAQMIVAFNVVLQIQVICF
jgi:hypothetical protein